MILKFCLQLKFRKNISKYPYKLFLALTFDKKLSRIPHITEPKYVETRKHRVSHQILRLRTEYDHMVKHRLWMYNLRHRQNLFQNQPYLKHFNQRSKTELALIQNYYCMQQDWQKPKLFHVTIRSKLPNSTLPKTIYLLLWNIT